MFKTITTQMKNLLSTMWPANWINISRALEIAAAGDHTVTIFFSKDYVSGPDDYKLIKDKFPDVRFEEKGDMAIEIIEPTAFIPYTEGQRCKLDLNELELSEGASVLLETAAKKLCFGVSGRDIAIRVATTIAASENSECIHSWQMAEAIQYRMPYPIEDEYAYTIAEKQDVKIGAITITSKLTVESAEKAIAYLENYLNEAIL